MAGPFDLTGQNIENTYQRVLQTPDGTTFYDGTGSLVTFTATAAAGGSNTQIQFNSASLLSGSSNFSFNYTTNNVILTGSILMSGSSSISGVDYIDFDTTVTTATSVGRLHWNDEDGTLELGLKGGVVSSEIGQGLVTRVVNKTSPLIDLLSGSYQVVVIGGAQGQRLSVRLAQGNNDANSAGTLGVVAEDILRNQEGFVVTVGLLKNRNTTGTLQGETWNDGDILYLSPTVAGQMTNIKPQAPQHTVIVGYVEYAHQNNGKIYVKIDNGYELDELHNVRITTASLTPGQLLVRSGSNNSGVWINSNQLTGSYGLTGSLTATSFTGSLFGTATTASYYQETDPIFTAKSASLATTGSNNFNGNQTITGSLVISGGLGLTVSDVNGNSIDANIRQLTANNFLSVDWFNRTLNDGSGNSTVDWTNKTLIDGNFLSSVDWENKFLNRFNGSSNVPSIDWNSQFLYADDGTTPHLGWSNTNNMEFPSTIESPITRVLGMDDSNKVFWTASSAIGGGGSNIPAFPYTGSAIISGSLIVTGSTTSTLGFTGSLFGTSSWAENVLSSNTAITASYLSSGSNPAFISLNKVNSLILSSSKDILLQSDNPGGTEQINLYAKDIIFSGSSTGTTTVLSYGNILPGDPYVNNTSSFNLGSPTAAWNKIYVSNNSLHFVSGSTSSSIGFNNGVISFNNATVDIPAGSTVPTASFAQTASSLNTATTVGRNLITLTNPTAVRYLRINADNSVTTLTAAQLQNDLGQYRTTLASDVSITAANTTLVDITGLSFPITAGKKYKFKATLLYGASSTTQGLRIGINADVSANAVYYMTTQVSNNAPAATSFVAFAATAFNATSSNTVAGLTAGIAFIEGYIDANNTGTVIGRFSKAGANAGTLTIRSGSFIDYEEFL